MDSSPASDTHASPWKAVLADLAILLAVLLVAYSKIIFAGQTFQVSARADWPFLAQPAYVYSGKALAHGEFPLWNTYWLAGFPHFAVPSNGMLYPTTVLFGLFSFAFAAKLVALGHVYIFAASSYWLARDMFSARVPALFLGVCGSIGSFSTWGLQGGQLWSIATIAWMPLAFLCLRRVLYGGRASWALILAPVLALMFFAGDPQTMSFVYLWFGAYTAATLTYRLLSRADSPTQVLAKGLLCLAAVVGGAGMASVQLLPSQELMGQSIRSGGVSYDFLRMKFLSGGTRYSNAAESYVFGLLQETTPESFIVPGKVTAALMLIAIFGAAYAEVGALWFTLAICLTFAGVSPWLFESVVKHVPVLNSMRGSYRIVGMTIFLSHVLAAHGIHALMRTYPRRYRWRWASAAAIAVALVFSSLWFDSRFFTLPVLTVLVFTLIALSVQWRAWPAGVLASALLAIPSVELVPNFLSDVGTEPDSVLEVTPDFQAFSDAREGIDRVHLVDPLSERVRHGTGVGLLTGDRLIEGSHALYLQRYSDLYEAFTGMRISTHDEHGVLTQQGPYIPDWITPDSFVLFDLLNVRYIVRHGLPDAVLDKTAKESPQRIRASRFGELYVYENLRALPPLFPIHEVVPISDSKVALEKLRTGDIDYRRQAILPSEAEIPPLAPVAGIEPITLKKYGPNSIEVTVSLTAPALLVLSEMWYPDWFAQVDGGPARRTLCVNTALQGTPVPAGEHHVRFFYRPSSVFRGMAVSAATLLLWAACVAALIVRRRRAARRRPASVQQDLAEVPE